ncbi:hypothetical protein EV714DRAFT_204114 [Schizophyllum commune]
MEEKTDIGSLRARLELCHPFDRARYVPLLCRASRLSIIRRPPHFGRSVFLLAVADALDVASPYPRKERWPNPIARRRPLFDFNSGVILYLDMGRLSFETYEDLEAQIVDLSRSAVIHFLDKYQSYIGYTEEERMEVLAEEDVFSLLRMHYTMRLVISAHPEAFIYVCVDNYTAPCETAVRSEDWPQITEIVNKSLFRDLSTMVASGLIDSGIFVGSSEMDGDPMALLTYEKEVDEWGDDLFGPADAPTPVPFVGELMDYASHSPDLQSAIGFTMEGVVALAGAVLGDVPQADELWERVSKIPSRTFSHNPNAENVWAAGDVVEILCDMAGTRTTKDDLHFERPVGLVVS